MQTASSLEGRLPVFVFPASLVFYLEDEGTHKQVLTLYNPYDFPLRFKVLCTAPRKFTVVDPEGSIKPRCCVDIVVRHNAISPAACHVTDKFRVHMQEHGHKQVIGKKDITATLLPGCPEPSEKSGGETEEFEQLQMPTMVRGSQPSLEQLTLSRESTGHGSHPPNYIVIAAAIVCILALLLPTEGDISRLPSYLQLTVHQKLIFAYTLGLVTMVILRT